MFEWLIIGGLWTGVLGGGAVILRHASLQAATRQRLFAPTVHAAFAPPSNPNFLARWLFLAGLRRPHATLLFLAASFVLFVVGLLAADILAHSPVAANFRKAAAAVPGGILDLLLPVLYIIPLIITVLPTAIPYLIVASARRQRIQQVHEDLPITLELLATLAESGMSFDAALDHVLEAQPRGRPLVTEFQTFRRELLAGRPRVESFRRLAKRLEVDPFTTFISAVVQAEQAGAGLAHILQDQANDLRDRRREKATELAMATPIKRLIPMVLCFLPPIVLWAIGPSMFSVLRMFDTFTKVGGKMP